MGSKRSKRCKQELELFPDKNNIKKNKDNDDPAEPDIKDFKIENDAVVLPAVVPAVVPKAPKRKKKNEGIDEVPKKLKKINESGNDTKKARPKKRRSKSVSILSAENIKSEIVPAMNGEAGMNISQNNISKVKNNHGDKDKKKEEIMWPDQDINELISRMETNIPEKDMLAYRSRVEKLNWNNVAFKDYTAEQCKSTWLLVQKRIRRFRLLSEILSDAKEWIRNPKSIHGNSRIHHKAPRPKKHPDMPRRPLSSYLLFYLKTKDQIISENPGLDGSDITKLVGQIYKNLPPETREKYEKLAATNKEEYLEKLKIFFENHPEFGPPPAKVNHKVEKDKTPKVEKEKTPKPEKAPKITPKVEKAPKIEKEKVTKVDKPKPKGEKSRGRPVRSESLKERPPKKCQTPFGLYYTSELKNMEPGTEKQAFREKCKLQYKEMSDKSKMYWITLAEQDLIRYQEEVRAYRAKYPEFKAVKVRPILTKKEKVAKERASGKPVKPPNSAYALYSRVMLQSDEIKSVHPKERMNYIASKWKNTTEDEKKSYADQVVSLNDDYRQQYQSFLDSLPEEERSKLMPKSKRKSGRRSRSGRIKKAKKRKSVKKENKPPAPPQLKFTEPEQPPISACKYFASLYKGEGDPVQAWKALPPEQKRQYEDELVKKKQAYIVEFERFLKSLSKEELEAFSKSRQQQVKSDDEESSECSSGSEGDDEDDDEDEENGEENGEENSENVEDVHNNDEDVHNNDEDVHESDTD